MPKCPRLTILFEETPTVNTLRHRYNVDHDFRRVVDLLEALLPTYCAASLKQAAALAVLIHHDAIMFQRRIRESD